MFPNDFSDLAEYNFIVCTGDILSSKCINEISDPANPDLPLRISVKVHGLVFNKLFF